MRLIIIGLGNKLFGDDGAGIAVAEKLQDILKLTSSVKITSTSLGGLRITDMLANYDRAIVIDSINTGEYVEGFIKKWDYDELINSMRMVSFHDVNFATAVEFAKKLGIPMPEEISVYTIEVSSVGNFIESLSPIIKTAVDLCAAMILAEIDKMPLHGNETPKQFIKNKKVLKC